MNSARRESGIRQAHETADATATAPDPVGLNLRILGVLGEVVGDLRAVVSGECASGPHRLTVAPRLAVPRLATAIRLLPTALRMLPSSTSYQLSYTARELRSAAALWADPRRYLAMADTLEALARGEMVEQMPEEQARPHALRVVAGSG